MDRLQTQHGSTNTLVRGMELANAPINSILMVKDEPPQDDDERAMQAEMQARWGGDTCSERTSHCMGGVDVPLVQGPGLNLHL